MITRNQTDNAIIEILSKQGNIPVDELHEKLTHEYQLKLSLSQLYNIINALRDSRIIIKEKGIIKLSNIRIDKVQELARMLDEQNILGDMTHINLKDGEHRVFFASNLVELDHKWLQVSVQLLKNQPKISTYSFSSHGYYILGLRDEEKDYAKYAHSKDHKGYYIIGGDSFLDQYALKLRQNNPLQTKIDTSLPFSHNGYCLNFAGEYILEIIFPSTLNTYFEQFFSTVDRIEDFDPEVFKSIFHMKAKCKFILRRSSQNTQHYKKLIDKSFWK